jgi:hypothetical protein
MLIENNRASISSKNNCAVYFTHRTSAYCTATISDRPQKMMSFTAFNELWSALLSLRRNLNSISIDATLFTEVHRAVTKIYTAELSEMLLLSCGVQQAYSQPISAYRYED